MKGGYIRSAFRAFMILVLLDIISMYPDGNDCPDPAHRKFRKALVCNNASVENYSCLFNERNKLYEESCTEEPDFVRRGYKYVLKGARDPATCSVNRFQPFIFWSNESSECTFLKDTCSELGQIVISNGSTISDSFCRCDYTKGFSFVAEPHHHCYCIPSQEDCTCIEKSCSINEILSQDYECIQKNLSRNRFSCDHLPETIDMQATAPNRSELNKGLHSSLSSKQKSIVEVFIVLTTTIIVFLCVAACKRTILLTRINCMLKLTACSTKNQGNPDDNLVARIIGNWSSFKTAVRPSILLDDLSKYGFISTNECIELKNKSRNKTCLFIIQILKDCTNSKRKHHLESLLYKHDNRIRNIVLSPVLIKRWPKRDEDLCITIIDSSTTIMKNIQPTQYVDHFFENFIFDIRDYGSVIEKEGSREEMAICFLNRIKATIGKGSFECLLEVLKTDRQLAYMFTELQNKLVPAIAFQLINTRRIIHAEHSNFESLRFYIKSDQDETLLDTAMLERIKLCSTFFVEELAMYPEIHFEKAEIVLIPLEEHICKRLQKSIQNEGFSNLLDLLFCKHEIVRTIRKKNLQTIHVILRPFNKKVKIETLEKIDHHLITRVARSFLKKNVELSMFLGLFQVEPTPKNDFFNMLQESNSVDWNSFISILKNNNETYILNVLNRLQECEPSVLKNNIIRNMSKLVETDIDLNQIIAFYEENNLTKDLAFVYSIELSDSKEQMMVLFLVKTLQVGSLAMLAFVQFLCENAIDIVDSLIRLEMKHDAGIIKNYDDSLSVFCQKYDIRFEPA